jgi:phosphoribosylformylglycinamidine cyclo-ligase
MPAEGRAKPGKDAKTRKEVIPSPEPLTYAAAGVDISAKTALLERLKPLFRSTFSPQVVGDVGAFGGFFSARDLGCEDPVLVASTDSVGTKVRVAALAGRHKNIGWDIVAHCANDIVCQGAKPLFFLDYFATAKLEPQVMEQVVQGLAEACRQAECALIGGETAELPGFYQPGDYDLVGFIVGVVDKNRRITGGNVVPGDVLIGLASDGLHTNGYSLARKLFFEIQGMSVKTFLPELGETIGEALLRPHRLYAPALLKLAAEFDVRGIAHITGGGLPDNLPRCLPEGCRAVIRRTAWEIPPIFQVIQQLGNVPDDEMFHTFNMGIGAVIVLPPDQAGSAITRLHELGEKPLSIGAVEEGERVVVIS